MNRRDIKENKPTAEDRETTMGLGDVVDEFLNQDSLSDTSTSEETNFSTTGVGGKEIDNLDTSFQNLGGSGLVNKGRGVGVDGGKLDTLDWATLVDRLTNDVHDTAKSGGTDRDHDGVASVDNLGTANETFCTVHGDGADRVLTEMGCDFKDKTATAEIHDLKGIEDRREVVGVELDIDDGTNDGFYRANGSLGLCRIGASWRILHKRREKQGEKEDQPGTEEEGAARGAETRDCWEEVGRAVRWARAADEKNAFVCFALLKALLERRATAPRVVSMVDERERTELNISQKSPGDT